MKRSRAPGQRRGERGDVAPQQRRQVGVDDGGLAAREQAQLARDLVRRDHVLEADLARERRERASGAGIARSAWISTIATASQPRRARAGERGARARARRAARASAPSRGDAAGDLDARAWSGAGLRIASAKSSGRSWVPIASRSPRPAVRRPAATARRAARAARWSRPSCRARTAQRGQRAAGAAPAAREDRADRRGGRLVRRQQLRDVERPVGREADRVGEGAAAVDPELPAAGRAHLRRAAQPAQRSGDEPEPRVAGRRVGREHDRRARGREEDAAAEREVERAPRARPAARAAHGARPRRPPPRRPRPRAATTPRARRGAARRAARARGRASRAALAPIATAPAAASPGAP